MKVQGYAAMTQGGRLDPYEFELGPLGPHEVQIEVECCGLCHSDVHLIDNDWQISKYPLVPGHEVIGRVVKLGGSSADVGGLREGDRVGVGWYCGACLECEHCRRGDQQLCPSNQATCVGRHGGFARSIRVDGRFVLPIPQSLSSEAAAPLLCGGITVYTPLRHMGVQPWHKVGILGVGGLGHMAVQFAAGFGCEVVALSSSKNKEAEVKKLGASHFFATAGATLPGELKDSLDFLLVTVPVDLEWADYLKMLRTDGKLCFVGAVPGTLHIPPDLLLFGRRSVTGSITGGLPYLREMLGFAAQHQIGAMAEVVPMSQVNAAIEKVRKNTARYRMVLRAGA